MCSKTKEPKDHLAFRSIKFPLKHNGFLHFHLRSAEDPGISTLRSGGMGSRSCTTQDWLCHLGIFVLPAKS